MLFERTHRVIWLWWYQESLFFISESLTVLKWSRLSDRIGRKPVLMIGLFGVGLSMLCFGLSTSFWTLVVRSVNLICVDGWVFLYNEPNSRCICGMLNGNSGVMRSMMGELTDSTNMAQGFALIPITWCFGGFFGSVFLWIQTRAESVAASLWGEL